MKTATTILEIPDEGSGVLVRMDTGTFIEGEKCIGYTVYHWQDGRTVAFTELSANPFNPDGPMCGVFWPKGSGKYGADAPRRFDLKSKQDGIDWGRERLAEIEAARNA